MEIIAAALVVLCVILIIVAARQWNARRDAEAETWDWKSKYGDMEVQRDESWREANVLNAKIEELSVALGKEKSEVQSVRGGWNEDFQKWLKKDGERETAIAFAKGEAERMKRERDMSLNRCDTLRAEIAALKESPSTHEAAKAAGTISGLRSDIEGLRSDIEGLRSDIEGLTAKLTERDKQAAIHPFLDDFHRVMSCSSCGGLKAQLDRVTDALVRFRDSHRQEKKLMASYQGQLTKLRKRLGLPIQAKK
jgi:chromosome segregation ATPase